MRSCVLALCGGKIAHRCCYVSVYFLLFCVGFQLVTQFNKNNFEFVYRIKISAYICINKTKQHGKVRKENIRIYRRNNCL